MLCLIARKGFNNIIITPADDDSRKELEKETFLKIIPLADQQREATGRPFSSLLKGYKA